MKTHTVITSALLSAFILAALACGGTQPLPDIDATAEAMAKAMVEATAQAAPTATPVPPAPTATPVPPAPTPEPPTDAPAPTSNIWEVFTDDSNSFSISVPSNWEVEMDLDLLSMQNPTVGVATLFYAIDESSGNNVMVVADLRELFEFEPQPIDINQYVESQIDDLQESVGKTTTINKTGVVVDGIETTQLRMNKSGIELIMNILISNEPRAMCGSMPLIVQGTSSSEDRPIIERALDSFTVLPTGAIGVNCDDRKSLSLAATPKTDFADTIFAGTIVDEFVDDFVSASEKYDLQILSVSGLVYEIDHDLNGNLYVSVSDYDEIVEFNTVWCMNPDLDEAKQLVENEQITVNGMFSEFDGFDVVLNPCSLIKEPMVSMPTARAPTPTPTPEPALDFNLVPESDNYRNIPIVLSSKDANEEISAVISLINVGFDDIKTNFLIDLYLDGKLVYQEEMDGLDNGYYHLIEGIQLGILNEGINEFSLVIDSANAIDEWDESDNVFDLAFTLQSFSTTITTIAEYRDLPPWVSAAPGATSEVVIGSDGLPLLSYLDTLDGAKVIVIVHCRNLGCTDFEAGYLYADYDIGSGEPSSRLNAALGKDGKALITLEHRGVIQVIHCNDIPCTDVTTSTPIDFTEGAKKSWGASGASIAMGSDGLGVISFYSSNLEVAHCEDVLCTNATITTIDSTMGAGRTNSITIGNDGLPLIAYSTGPLGHNEPLRVAHCDDFKCTSATISSHPLSNPYDRVTAVDITSGTDGMGLISYREQNAYDLKVAHCEDLLCTTSTLTTLDGKVGRYPTIAIGSDGLGVISYVDSNGRMKIAHCVDLVCGSADMNVIDPNNPGSLFQYVGGEFHTYASGMAIGADGLLVLTYQSSKSFVFSRCWNVSCSP